MINLKNKPYSLFGLDAAGAFLTAFMHGIVLIKFQSYFGMPKNVLLQLAIVALIYACYSTLCYFIKPENWRPYLRAIGISNLLFCLLTLVLLFYYKSQITLLAWIYFIVEICIICFISRVELNTVKRGIVS